MQAVGILQHFNLLFVDDDIQAAADAYALFSPQFKSVTLAHTTRHALEIVQHSDIDLVITDIQMPGDDGLTLVENIRTTNVELPIVVLSAFSEQDYLLRAANLRIDGYIIKPLTSKKLLPVFNKVALRLQSKIASIKLGGHTFYNAANRTLTIDNTPINLGKKEHALLNLFVHNLGHIISKEDIRKVVWPHNEMSDSALKSLLCELRRKLQDDLIKNIPSQGWVLNRRDTQD